MTDILQLINPEGLNYFTPDTVYAFLLLVIIIEAFVTVMCSAMSFFRR